MPKKIIINLPILRLRDIIFISILVVYCLTASDTVGARGSMYKYLVLGFGTIFETIFFLKKREKKIFCKKEFKGLMMFALIAALYSVFFSIINNHFSFRIIQEFLFLVFPIIYSFLYVNNSNEEQVNNCLSVGFFICFLLYIISLGMNFREIYNSLLISDFFNSDSMLESSIYSGISFCFISYFIIKGTKSQKILGMLFVFMTFKRLSILTSMLLFVVSLNKKLINKNISKKVVLSCTIAIFIVSIIIFLLLKPNNVYYLESVFNLDISKLTMTRSDRYAALFFSDFNTYGFGSSNEYMYNNFGGALEMDLIRIIIELGFIPLFIFIYEYLKLGQKKCYLFVFMTLKLISMILTSCLTSAISWVILFTIIFILLKECENNETFNHNSCL